jgi:hypothetical protein
MASTACRRVPINPGLRTPDRRHPKLGCQRTTAAIWVKGIVEMLGEEGLNTRALLAPSSGRVDQHF